MSGNTTWDSICETGKIGPECDSLPAIQAYRGVTLALYCIEFLACVVAFIRIEKAVEFKQLTRQAFLFIWGIGFGTFRIISISCGIGGVSFIAMYLFLIMIWAQAYDATQKRQSSDSVLNKKYVFIFYGLIAFCFVLMVVVRIVENEMDVPVAGLVGDAIIAIVVLLLSIGTLLIAGKVLLMLKKNSQGKVTEDKALSRITIIVVVAMSLALVLIALVLASSFGGYSTPLVFVIRFVELFLVLNLVVGVSNPPRKKNSSKKPQSYQKNNGKSGSKSGEQSGTNSESNVA